MGLFKHKERRIGRAEGKRRYDLPLAHSESTSFLVLLIGMMAFLALMATATNFVLSGLTQRWSSGLENRLTIEIPAEKSAGGLRTEDDLAYLKEESTKILSADKTVKTVEPLDESDFQSLLGPWLGDSLDLKELPLPALIAVEIKDSKEPGAISALQTKLKKLNKDIRIDTHQEWLRDLLRLTGALQTAAFIVMVIISLTTIIAVAGAMRSRMAEHKQDVELLHLMGAQDSYITRQFQRHALLLSLQGSFAGTAFGGFVLILISLISGSAGVALLPDFQFESHHFLLFLSLPILISLLATFAARYTVLRVLSLMP